MGTRTSTGDLSADEQAWAARHFDASDFERMQDPFPYFRYLRDEHPLTRSDAHLDGFWVVSRHEDIRALALDHRRFSSAGGVSIPPLGNERPLIPIETDPPDHRQYRLIINDLFAPRSVARLEPAIRSATRSLVQRIVADHRGRSDLVRSFAYEQPMIVMWSEPFLGDPLLRPGHDVKDMTALFQSWVHDFKHDPDRTTRAAGVMRNYLGDVLRDRESRPRNDIPTRLLNAEVAGRPLSFEEALDYLFLLLSAGTATTGDALSASLLHLATNNDTRIGLLSDGTNVELATEELIRCFGPSQAERRTATADVELHGKVIRAGAPVQLLWNSANRDERVFARPDEVILDRSPNPHIGFGAGIHRCVGLNLARLQIRVSIEEWLRAVPEFGLAPDAEIRWSVGLDRSLRALDVVW